MNMPASIMQRLLDAAGWDAGSTRHKQLKDAMAGAGLALVDRAVGSAQGARASAIDRLVQVHKDEMTKLGQMQDCTDIERNWQGGNVAGISTAIMEMKALTDTLTPAACEGVEFSLQEKYDAALDEINRLTGLVESARGYVERAIASYAGDPADNNFQRGFLAALEVVRDEAFCQSDPSTVRGAEDEAGDCDCIGAVICQHERSCRFFEESSHQLPGHDETMSGLDALTITPHVRQPDAGAK